MSARGWTKISICIDCTEIRPYISTIFLIPMIEYDWLLGFGKKVYVRIGHELEKNDLHKFCTNHGSLNFSQHKSPEITYSADEWIR